MTRDFQRVIGEDFDWGRICLCCVYFAACLGVGVMRDAYITSIITLLFTAVGMNRAVSAFPDDCKMTTVISHCRHQMFPLC